MDNEGAKSQVFSQRSEKRSMSPSSSASTNSNDKKKLKSDEHDQTDDTPDFSDSIDDLDDVNLSVASSMDFSSSSTTVTNFVASGSTFPSSTYNVVSTDDISRKIKELVDSTSTVMNLPPVTVRALLNYHAWNRESLMENFFGGGDTKKLLNDAGIDGPITQGKLLSLPASGGKEECLICCCETNSDNIVGINCGHNFCKNCWKESLTSQILQQGNGAKITCIAHNCSTLVDDESLEKLISDNSILMKFRELVMNRFVQTNPSYKWCPGPDCSKAIEIQEISRSNPQVNCVCSTKFCFQCSGIAHAPINCEMIKRWESKCNGIRDPNSQWIASNTKACPRCNVNIEKNGGCTYMTCANRNCGFEFCWICLKSMKNLDYDHSQCTEDQNQQNSAPEDQDVFDERFHFYYNRYKSQVDTSKLEAQLLKSIQRDMSASVKSPTEIHFIKLATETLLECRNTLQNTYVFAFFVKSCTQVDLFISNQIDLQKSVEKLSGSFEENTTWESLVTAKTEIQDQTVYCQSRNKAILSQVFEGLSKSEDDGGWGFH